MNLVIILTMLSLFKNLTVFDSFRDIFNIQPSGSWLIEHVFRLSRDSRSVSVAACRAEWAVWTWELWHEGICQGVTWHCPLTLCHTAPSSVTCTHTHEHTHSCWHTSLYLTLSVLVEGFKRKECRFKRLQGGNVVFFCSKHKYKPTDRYSTPPLLHQVTG